MAGGTTKAWSAAEGRRRCVRCFYGQRMVFGVVSFLTASRLTSMNRCLAAIVIAFFIVLFSSACRGDDPVNGDGDAVLIGDDAGGDITIDTGDDVPGLDVGIDISDPDTGDPDIVDPDSGDPDTGDNDVVDPDTRVCRPDFRQCVGDLLQTCSPLGDAVVEFNCQGADSFCAPVNGVPDCIDWFCEPNSRGCNGSDRWTCNIRGSDYAGQVPCPAGCDGATGECLQAQPVCELSETVTELEAGSQVSFDLCGAGDSVNPVEGGIDCGDFQSRGEDRIFRFHLETRRAVFLQLSDADSEQAVDTVLSVRRECDDAATQVVCSDDLPCNDSTVSDGCFDGGTQPRESRIVRNFEAGDYFVLADHYTYNNNSASFGCGFVSLFFDTGAPQ